MADLSHEVAKALIESSLTTEEVNETIEAYLGNSPTYAEKVAFLKGMFDLKVDVHEGDSDESIYNLMLEAIITF